MQITMLVTKLGCAMQPNISLFKFFFVKVSQTFVAWGNLDRVKHYMFVVRHFRKTAMLLLLSVVTTHLTNVGSFKLGGLQDRFRF